MNSHEMLSRFLRGDKNISLEEIKKQEKKELIDYYLRFFKNKILKIIFTPVALLIIEIFH